MGNCACAFSVMNKATAKVRTISSFFIVFLFLLVKLMLNTKVHIFECVQCVFVYFTHFLVPHARQHVSLRRSVGGADFPPPRLCRVLP